MPPKITAFPIGEKPVEPSLVSDGTQQTSPTSRTAEESVFRDLPPSTNLPVVQRQFPWAKIRLAAGIAGGLAGVGLLSWVLAMSPLTTRMINGADQLLRAAGITKPIIGEGLNLQQIRSERRFEEGAMQLVVEGEVHNESDETRPVPDINIKALGPGKAAIQSWRITAPAATLSAGASAPFHSSIIAPQGAVMEVNLSFIEPKHDANP